MLSVEFNLKMCRYDVSEGVLIIGSGSQAESGRVGGC